MVDSILLTKDSIKLYFAGIKLLIAIETKL